MRIELENAGNHTLLEGLGEANVMITNSNISLAHESPVKVTKN